MKVVWEEEDIMVGRRYSRKGIETWLIGFLAGGEEGCNYVSVSLADGMVSPAETKAGMARKLTEGAYLPVEVLRDPERGSKDEKDEKDEKYE